MIQAFYQANLVDAYGFLDVRGALGRQFGPDFQSVREALENETPLLHFSQPVDASQPLVEIKVGVPHIWLHFREDSTRVEIRQEASRVVDKACGLMGVTRLARQGLRVYTLFETEDESTALSLVRRNAVATAAEWQRLGEVTFTSAIVQVRAEKLLATIHLAPIRSVPAPGRSPSRDAAASDASSPAETATFGVLLDSDIFTEEVSDSRDSKPHLHRAIDFLDDQVLPFASKLLGDPE